MANAHDTIPPHISIPPLPDINPTAGSKVGYPSAPQLHDHYSGSHHISYEPSIYKEPSYKEPGKALGLKDLFDIALTTLAFLSFGLFILQVLMCITLTKQQSAGMIMMPGVDNGNGGGEEIDMQARRIKRAIEADLELEKKVMNDMNEIARRAVISMDALDHARKDDGLCVHKVICENNKFVRNRKDNQRFYLPMWG